MCLETKKVSNDYLLKYITYIIIEKKQNRVVSFLHRMSPTA